MAELPPHVKDWHNVGPLAKRLRSNMTDEERLLWAELKGFRGVGFAFRKQAAIGPYVADFLCRKILLIVEVDGRHHDQQVQIEHDRKRDLWMTAHGYTVLRFAAREIWQNMDDVILAIEQALSVPLPQGGGGASSRSD